MGVKGVTYNTRKLDQMIRELRGTPARILHDGVEYGVYNEFGTTKQAAHPFMTPALEAIYAVFDAGLKQVIERGLMSLDDYVEYMARQAEAVAKANVAVDTGALKNSIAVHKPEEFNT